MTPQLEKDIREWHRTSEGWMEVERMMEMAQLILDNKPDVVVELGVFGGRSFITQGMALKENGRGRIYGIDPWKLEPAIEGESQDNIDWWRKLDLNQIHQYCMNAVWKFGLEKWSIPMRCCSQDCYDIFQDIDILNIDACHSEVASCRDVSLFVPRVKMGGYIWMDDCDWPTTRVAQRWIEETCDVKKISHDGHYKLYQKTS